MKINQWTLGLAAVGLVSLASVARAEEKSVPLLTALSSTTISGYVDTSLNWKPGTGNQLPGARQFDGVGKQDSFNVNVVSLSLDKPLDEGQWSAGYHVQAILGPDIAARGTRMINHTVAPFGAAGVQAGDIALHEAYVALRAPVGNGLDFKIGQWVTPIGYEGFDGYKNPNYSRSYAFTALEPATHVGVQANYVISEAVSIMGGVANSYSAPIDSKAATESSKTYITTVTLTAPQSMGALKGSSLTLGYINGQPDASSGSTERIENFYAGATLATPLAGLTIGAAYDYQEGAPIFDTGTGALAAGTSHGWAAAAYASFQATEKLKFNLRGEYITGSPGVLGYGAPVTTFTIFGPVTSAGVNNEMLSVTATADYALWQNVLTRAEARWDHELNGNRPFGTPTAGSNSGGDNHNALTFALNVVYKF